ncbi:MAG: hypothetical protein JWN78_406 [Bacteroidota bacterium]|nr:hypothetical protein [Bacteroidota bacterium]
MLIFNKQIKIVAIATWLLLGCNREPKSKFSNIFRQFDFEHCGYENIGPTDKQIDSFEFSKGSIKINYEDSDILKGYDLYYDSFFASKDMGTHPRLYLRPTKNSSFKYIVAYFYPYDDAVISSIGKIYYQDHILDNLLPDSIKENYKSASFDLKELLHIEREAINYYDSLYRLNAEWRAFKKESKKEEIKYFNKQQKYYPAVLKENPWLADERTRFSWVCYNPYASVTIDMSEAMESVRNYPYYLLKDGRRISYVEYISGRYGRDVREGSIEIGDTVRTKDLCIFIKLSGNPYKLVY